MDLTAPLRSLVPTLDSAVLEVLAGTQSGLSATQIARVAKRGSRAGLGLALDRLVDHGLVLAEPANRGFMYRLNRDHVLTGALVHALGVRGVVYERLTESVHALAPAPIHTSVFGSFARADGTEDSDIDLLVVTPDDLDTGSETWTRQLQTLADHALLWTGNRLETLVLSQSTLREAIRNQEPVISSILEDGVGLTGESFDTLVRDLSAVEGAQ